jgi:hypothetical protein
MELFDEKEIEANVHAELGPEFSSMHIDAIRKEVRLAHSMCIHTGYQGYSRFYSVSVDVFSRGQQIIRSGYKSWWSRVFEKNLLSHSLKPWNDDQRIFHAVFKAVSAVLDDVSL